MAYRSGDEEDNVSSGEETGQHTPTHLAWDAESFSSDPDTFVTMGTKHIFSDIQKESLREATALDQLVSSLKIIMPTIIAHPLRYSGGGWVKIDQNQGAGQSVAVLKNGRAAFAMAKNCLYALLHLNNSVPSADWAFL